MIYLKLNYALYFCMVLLSLSLTVNAQKTNTQEISNMLWEEDQEIIDLQDPDVLQYIRIRDELYNHLYSMRFDKLEKKWQKIDEAKSREEVLKILELTDKELKLYRQQNEMIKQSLTIRYPELGFGDLDFADFMTYMHNLTSSINYSSEEKLWTNTCENECKGDAVDCILACNTLIFNTTLWTLCRLGCIKTLFDCLDMCPSGNGNGQRNIVESTESVNYKTLDANIFPKPAKNILTLRAEIPESNSVTIQIYDALGSKIYEISAYALEGIYQRELRLPNNTPTGTYIVKLKTGKYATTQKILITKN